MLRWGPDSTTATSGLSLLVFSLRRNVRRSNIIPIQASLMVKPPLAFELQDLPPFDDCLQTSDGSLFDTGLP